jgi:hypothetical protein
MISIPHHSFSGQLNQDGDGRGMWLVWGEVCAGFFVGKHEGKSHFKTSHRWEDKTTTDFQELG